MGLYPGVVGPVHFVLLFTGRLDGFTSVGHCHCFGVQSCWCSSLEGNVCGGSGAWLVEMAGS
jgi:hypothetical protein